MQDDNLDQDIEILVKDLVSLIQKMKYRLILINGFWSIKLYLRKEHWKDANITREKQQGYSGYHIRDSTPLLTSPSSKTEPDSFKRQTEKQGTGIGGDVLTGN